MLAVIPVGRTPSPAVCLHGYISRDCCVCSVRYFRSRLRRPESRNQFQLASEMGALPKLLVVALVSQLVNGQQFFLNEDVSAGQTGNRCIDDEGNPQVEQSIFFFIKEKSLTVAIVLLMDRPIGSIFMAALCIHYLPLALSTRPKGAESSPDKAPVERCTLRPAI